MTDIDLNAESARGVLLVAQVALTKAGYHGLPAKLEKIGELVARLTEERDQYAAVIEKAEVTINDLTRPWHHVFKRTLAVLRSLPAATLAARDAEKKAEGQQEERREWADYIETSLAHVMPVGTPPLTAERIAELLRGPRPFGLAAAQQGEPQ